MAEHREASFKAPNTEEMSRLMSNIAERSQRLVTEFIAKQSQDGSPGTQDPFEIGKAFFEMSQRLMSDPTRMVQAQMTLWQDYLSLWQTTSQRLMGSSVDPVIAPTKDDRRFKDEAWSENEVFDFIKQSYLLTANWMQGVVANVDGLDSKTHKKVAFYTKQYTDALSPTNFVATNPQVLKATIESGGENLLKGLQNLLDDLDRGKGKLRISMTDEEAFQVGENVATTPGKVVFQNEMMQLLQFTPTTEQVYKRPLLIVPPWINKYYILDLRPKNSFIKWCVDQGFTTFVISWVNPDSGFADKGFEDYMEDGPLAALDAIKRATGESIVNTIGYCIGGTLMAATLAYMKAKQDDRIASITYFTTMIDFSEPGDLGVFIDDAQLDSLEATMENLGYLDGSEMSTTFNMLRANDLIWSFVINNYLMGKDPFPFDLLYWNSDSTRMPKCMHVFYLRKMYLENKLIEPGGITLGDVPIDLRTIDIPSYVLSTKDDHIAPWMSTYAAMHTYAGAVKFVLAGSGHIAGVINPPAAEKYCYWTRSGKAPKDPQKWLDRATRHEGSWWPDWQAWLARKSGAKVAARTPGDGELAVIEDAPGSYVKVRLLDGDAEQA